MSSEITFFVLVFSCTGKTNFECYHMKEILNIEKKPENEYIFSVIKCVDA